VTNDTRQLGFASARKVAEHLDISERTVRAKGATGEWPSYCVGGRRLFDLDEIIALVKSRPGQRGPMTPEQGRDRR
jgi:hypothetical protein